MKMPKYKFRAILFVCATLWFCTTSCKDNKSKDDLAEHQLSKPGEYKGYSEPIYADDHNLTSQYIEMRDGVKIAIDIYRPKDKNTGEVIKDPLPVIWMHTPYNRRWNDRAQEKLTIDDYAGAAGRLIKFGYVVATADFRGLFASYGHNEGNNRGEWQSSAKYDAYDITEWLAEQPWSNGNVGMWGCSATGGSVMQAVTTAPPHLKAVFAMSFEFDVFDFRVPGGITGARGGVFPRKPGDPTPHEDRDARAIPVDDDVDGTQLKEAIAEHAGTIESPGYLPYRDGYSTEFTDEASKQWWLQSSPTTYMDKINASGIPMYMAVNWDEGNTKPGPFLAFNNYTTPKKLLLGPGVHCDWKTAFELTGFDIVIEELRFFDFWLKGIENGVMEEPPVYYFTYNSPEGSEWRTAQSWPIPREKKVDFFLGDDGTLINTPPVESEGKDQTTVSYDKESDGGALIYETAPLEKDIEITGHSKINLWVSSTANDGDFVATVNDVAPDGTITSYNYYGQLRASMRKLGEPPYNNLGLPWHPANETDVDPLEPGKPTELEIAILPISMVFEKGHKIQLKISFVSRGTPTLDPAPQVTIYRDSEHTSYLTLPIIE
ncbi:CocE/NonD family hydrolase [Flagellimonas sp. GZD32]|uniref:CocE/NonD family hydrolase n=1 Tax=Flagellimonas cixiensis TaxID=3228750 RepID=UPI0035C8D069